MNENTVTIEQIEYAELIIKAWKYDQLRKLAEKSTYNSEAERAIFELRNEEKDS